MRLLLVLVGGAFGSLARYVVALATVQRFGVTFPWGTLTVNLVGSFLIGLVAALADESGHIGPDTRLLLIVGLLGGFTTFSSFSLETLRLLEGDTPIWAVANVLSNVGCGLAGAYLGTVAGRAWG